MLFWIIFLWETNALSLQIVYKYNQGAQIHKEQFLRLDWTGDKPIKTKELQ